MVVPSWYEAGCRDDHAEAADQAQRRVGGVLLLHSVCVNHALLDGNKRLAWAAVVTLLALNGYPVPDIDVDAAETLVVGVAAGKITEVADISRDLRSPVRAIAVD